MVIQIDPVMQGKATDKVGRKALLNVSYIRNFNLVLISPLVLRRPPENEKIQMHDWTAFENLKDSGNYSHQTSKVVDSFALDEFSYKNSSHRITFFLQHS